jgi:hypothetical protein
LDAPGPVGIISPASSKTLLKYAIVFSSSSGGVNAGGGSSSIEGVEVVIVAMDDNCLRSKCLVVWLGQQGLTPK